MISAEQQVATAPERAKASIRLPKVVACWKSAKAKEVAEARCLDVVGGDAAGVAAVGRAQQVDEVEARARRLVKRHEVAVVDDDRRLARSPRRARRASSRRAGSAAVGTERCGCAQPSLTSFTCRSTAELTIRSAAGTLAAAGGGRRVQVVGRPIARR